MYSDKTENKGRRFLWPLLIALVLVITAVLIFGGWLALYITERSTSMAVKVVN